MIWRRCSERRDYSSIEFIRLSCKIWETSYVNTKPCSMQNRREIAAERSDVTLFLSLFFCLFVLFCFVLFVCLFVFFLFVCLFLFVCFFLFF